MAAFDDFLLWGAVRGRFPSRENATCAKRKPDAGHQSLLPLLVSIPKVGEVVNFMMRCSASAGMDPDRYNETSTEALRGAARLGLPEKWQETVGTALPQIRGDFGSQ